MLGAERPQEEEPNAFGGRPTCARCLRPMRGCYCAHLQPIDTRTKLVLLQHPREREVAIGTAHMASLCLTRSELHVGIDWTRSKELDRALSDPEHPPILLYPGKGAIDIVREPPPGPVTLVVVDGTWSQTKKVVRMNPNLAALPRYAFVPPSPSEYRIRKEPDAASVATIEALVHALTALEGERDGERFERLLAPFRAMIDFQIECELRARGTPSRHTQRRARVRRLRVPRVISERADDIVCVAAEANAWPYALRASDLVYADELVHWAAFRPATGETLSFVVAPRNTIAPGTVPHTGLDEAALRAGGSIAELEERWRAFVRDTDVICSWGRYEPGLFVRAGGYLPPKQLDLRHVARDITQGSIGTLSAFHARSGPPNASTSALDKRVGGRAGRKLRAIADIVASMNARARLASGLEGAGK
jgi:DTW domain-containing protein